MNNRRTLSDVEISQTADELVIRARRMAVVMSAVAVFLLVPFSLFIAHQNIMGTADVPPVWDRPTPRRWAPGWSWNGATGWTCPEARARPTGASIRMSAGAGSRRGDNEASPMHLRDLPVLIAIAIGLTGFTLMVLAFALSAGKGGWRHVMQPDPLQRWTLPRRLMFAGAALGVAFGVLLFILAVLPGGLPWRR